MHPICTTCYHKGLQPATQNAKNPKRLELMCDIRIVEQMQPWLSLHCHFDVTLWTKYSPMGRKMLTNKRANVLSFYRYELLLEAVDGIVRESYSIRQTMGLPEKENDDLPDDFSKYCSTHSFSTFFGNSLSARSICRGWDNCCVV